MTTTCKFVGTVREFKSALTYAPFYIYVIPDKTEMEILAQELANATEWLRAQKHAAFAA